MNQQPIFIVGVPRSGTTLLAAMLGAHSRLSCGPETGFFSALALLPWRTRSGLLQRRGWPDRAADFICERVRNEKPLIENYGVTRDDITAFLRCRPPSIPAMLASLTEQFMNRRGKARWVEKTPDHLRRPATLRRYFPHAPIIRIVRDPRDVALSLLRVPWGPSTLAGGLAVWREIDGLGAPFFESDKLGYTLRYEDLVASPKEELTKLCQFLDEPFEEAMLNTSRSGQEVNRTNEPWKEKAAAPIDRSRCAAWRSQLDAEAIRLAECLVGDRLAAYYGQSPGRDFAGYCSVFPLLSAKNYPQVFTALAAKNIRIWPAHESEKPMRELYVGNPDEDGWLTRLSGERLRKTLGISSDVLRSKLAGRHVYWICSSEPKNQKGVCNRTLGFVMKTLATIRPPSWLVQEREGGDDDATTRPALAEAK